METLAKISAEYKRLNFINPKEGILLLTCHRAEFYLHENNKTLDGHTTQKFCLIGNTYKAYSRLFEIALGLHSQIIGENSIFQQVSQSIHAHLYYFSDPVLLEILRKAKKIRDEFDFYAPNHGQLIYKSFNKSKSSRTLVLIGAGMLNHKILNSLRSDKQCYSRVILITRDIKKAKEKYDYIHDVEINTIGKIDTTRISEKFDVILATNDITEEYATCIVQLCNTEYCINIADLSSIPIDGINKLSKNYYSLFTENTKRLIEVNNVNMYYKKNLVLNYLARSNFDFYEQIA